MQGKLVRSGVVLAVTAALFVCACAPGADAEAAKKASVKQKKFTLFEGASKKIVIKNKNSKRKYVFSTNKKGIATVSKSGTVKAKKEGKAVITVKETYKVKKKKKTVKVGKVTVTVKKKKDIQTTPTAPGTQTGAPLAPGTQTAAPSGTTPAPQPTEAADGVRRLYVSTTGSDSADGSKSQPFRTLNKAKEAVRAMDKSKGDIVVEIADGFYTSDETIVFTEEDSGTENCTITYRAAAGAKPVLSGGEKLESAWQEADDVDWLTGGRKAYKTPLTRGEKLRAVYVNGERASMTMKTGKPVGAVGSYTVTKDQADWAWAPSTTTLYTGTVLPASLGLSADTRNPQNIELESGSRWAKQLVCAETLTETAEGDTEVTLQMPYGALAQNLGWNTEYNPTGSVDNDVVNVFEWLENPGEFYFDQAGSMLYYIPRDGEDMSTAEVVVPDKNTILEIAGDAEHSKYVENVVFEGLSFAYSDCQLYELEGSHGYASVQGAIMMKNFGLINQHDDIYRTYDVPSAAVHVNTAKNVRFLDGEIRHTGCLGIHMENAVTDCEITGNYVAKTGGAGIVIGHPQHVYENDTEIHQTKAVNAAGPDKEKFKDGTEAVPKNILITNNYMYENCYFFPGHSPLTSFYTYNMQVLHNFVYKCSYSGMSIGWGWCNFDGASADKGDTQLPGVPTTTSKNNHVNYNRVEEICSLLQDAGGIYTLGQQGNDDWTEYSEMSFNYINAKREPQVANGSRMVNGFHPDEGSAYIKFDSNVVTNTIRNVYELNDWRRKHDMIVTNSFSNTDRSETTAPNCTLEQYVNEQYIWPLKGYETVLYSGLEDKYVFMVDPEDIRDTDYELAANVRLAAGQKLPRRGLLSKEDEVWLAEEGTTTFAEGPDMTKAAGNEKTIDVPEVPGEYKLYIRYAGGGVSSASTFTLYVGESTDAANVAEGGNYNVSKLNPLTLELKDDAYRYTLNGKEVSNGSTIDTSGTWKLKITDQSTSEQTEITFSTTVTEANQLLEDNVTVGSGGTVTFSNVLSDAGKTIWLAPSGLSAFDENDPTMSKTAGNSSSMNAPVQAGVYILTVVGADGDIVSQSDAKVTVE